MKSWAEEMAWRTKLLGSKPGDISSNPSLKRYISVTQASYLKMRGRKRISHKFSASKPGVHIITVEPCLAEVEGENLTLKRCPLTFTLAPEYEHTHKIKVQ